MILMLTRIPSWLGKAIVERHPSGPRHVREDAIEHTASLGVDVPAPVHQLSQEAPALRSSPPVDPFDARTILAQGIGPASRVARRIAQKAQKIAYAGEAQSQDQRIPGSVHQFVDPARTEAAGEITIGATGTGARAPHCWPRGCPAI